MVLSVLALSGCGWVDATGVQAGEQMVGAPPTALPVALADGGIVEINENSTQRVFIPRSTAAWTWLPRLNTDSIEQCRLVDGFDTSLAQHELNLACTDAKNCEIFIKPTGTGFAAFRLMKHRI